MCSTALQTSSIWANTIGLQEEQKGTNQAIEASIYAPGGGGRGREAKRQRAQELIEASEFVQHISKSSSSNSSTTWVTWHA
jgi:hypothetical protein